MNGVMRSRETAVYINFRILVCRFGKIFIRERRYRKLILGNTLNKLSIDDWIFKNDHGFQFGFGDVFPFLTFSNDTVILV